MSYNQNTPYPQTIVYADKYSTNGTLHLDAPLANYDMTKLVVSFLNCSIANTFPNITAGVNSLFEIWVEGTGTLQYSFTTNIYNVYTCITALNSFLSLNNTTLQFSYSKDTCKLTLGGAKHFTITANTTLWREMGLHEGSDVSDTNYSLELPNTVRFNGSPYLFLKITNISCRNLKNGVNDGCLQRIPINCNFGNMIVYQPPFEEQHLITATSVGLLYYKLTDHLGNELNVDYQFTLKIQYIYPAETKAIAFSTDSIGNNRQDIHRHYLKYLKFVEDDDEDEDEDGVYEDDDEDGVI